MSEQTDEIMGLADEYATETRRRQDPNATVTARAALYAAVEQIVAQREDWEADARTWHAHSDANAERAERAEQENETLRKVLDRVQVRQEGEESALERAEREAAEYERDAARWQAIKPYFRVMSPDIGGRHYWTLRGGVPRGANMDEVADAAIDAARRGNERPLVKRLRDYARDYTGTNYHDRLIHEAADRIEQLERDNAALREVLKDIKTARDEHYWTADLDAKISTALSQTKGKA